MDYDSINNCQTSLLSLAGLYPLFFNSATKEQAEYVHQHFKNHFLKTDDFITTLHIYKQTGKM